MLFTFYALPAMLSSAVMLVLIFYILAQRRNRRGAWLVTVLLVSFLFWSSSYAMVLMSPALPDKVFWFNLAQIGPDFAPVLFFFLTLEHTGRSDWLRRKVTFLTLAFPVVTTVLMWTNDAHHLLRSTVALSLVGPTAGLAIQRGPWFFLEVVYGYLVLCWSLVLLVRFFRVSSSKRQIVVLIGSLCLPIGFNLLDLFSINPFRPFGASSIAFSLTGVILAWGLFREHLLHLQPIARTVVLENLADGVIVLDGSGRIADANPAAHRLFLGSATGRLGPLGRPLPEVLAFWNSTPVPLGDLGSANLPVEVSVNGDRRTFHTRATPILDRTSRPIGSVLIFSDVTELRAANELLRQKLDEITLLQERLRDQAIRDSLTGCFNRHHLAEVLAKESARARREGRSLGLIMLDVDHFKRINDTHGHTGGDAVLAGLGAQLRGFLRTSDSVFRFGGEEFLAVLPGVSRETLAGRAEELRRLVAGSPADVTISLGTALFPADGDDIDRVLTNADQALYAAKKGGRNAVVDFSRLIP